MSTTITRFITSSPEQTTQLARNIAPVLKSGDTLLLQGDIGAGKTHFARALIQSLQDAPEDVPSPTFTLIQTYDTRSGALWHADLYRLSSPEEIVETGLLDAMDDAICLIEWPDRLGADAPDNALWLEFRLGDENDTRQITASSAQPGRWSGRLEMCHV